MITDRQNVNIINMRDKGTILVFSSHTPSLFWFRIEMMKEFQKRGYKVYAVGNESEEIWKDRFNDVLIPYRSIAVSRNGTNPAKDLYTLRSIIKLIRELNPNKIFAYQAKTVIYTCLAAHIVGGIEVYPLIAGIGSVFLSEELKSRLIRRVLVAEYRAALKHASAVFFQNNDDLCLFSKFDMIGERQQTVLIPGSGVNTSHFRPLPQPDTFGFLYIGRLIKDKGIFEYLEACRIVKQDIPEIRCLLVGPYDTNPTSLTPEQLQPYIDDGIIEYFGEQDDIRPYLAQCSVYVLPSYREGIPKTVLEAMACGRAVITTDAPGCRETVIDGETGFLVRVGSIPDLAEKMRCVWYNKSQLEYMGKMGRGLAEMRFDVRIVNEIICNTMGVNQRNL